jgi:hypothetical protein
MASKGELDHMSQSRSRVVQRLHELSLSAVLVAATVAFGSRPVLHTS